MKELNAAAEKVAAGLLAIGVQPGDRVAVWVGVTHEFYNELTSVLHCITPLIAFWRLKNSNRKELY